MLTSYKSTLYIIKLDAEEHHQMDAVSNGVTHSGMQEVRMYAASEHGL